MTTSHILVKGNKYWSISLKNNVTTIEYGVIGLAVGSKSGTKTHKSEHEAEVYTKQKVEEKLARGYEEHDKSVLAEEQTRLIEQTNRKKEKEDVVNRRLTRAAANLQSPGKRSAAELEEEKGAEGKSRGKRSKPETLQDRCAELLASNKVNRKQVVEQYKKEVAKFTEAYAENKRTNKFTAINVVGKELYIESGKIGSSGEVTKRVLPSHEQACEEAVEIISGRVADGYQKVVKKKEYRIDYSKAKEDKEASRGEASPPPEAEGDGTDILMSEIDDSYLRTIKESLNDLESRYGTDKKQALTSISSTLLDSRSLCLNKQRKG